MTATCSANCCLHVRPSAVASEHLVGEWYSYDAARRSHPIYTGLFLSFIGFILRAYSVSNLLAAATVMALFMIKSVVEERFLAHDEQYAEYLRRVRWRWVPGVA